MFNVLSLMATGFGTTLQLLVLDEEVETAGEGICASSFMLWAVSVALHHTGATATLLPLFWKHCKPVAKSYGEQNHVQETPEHSGRAPNCSCIRLNVTKAPQKRSLMVPENAGESFIVV